MRFKIPTIITLLLNYSKNMFLDNPSKKQLIKQTYDFNFFNIHKHYKFKCQKLLIPTKNISKL